MGNHEAKQYYNKGVGYNNEGIYNLAANNFIKALELAPDFIEAHFDLGAVYIKDKQYDLAIESFNNVLKLNPDEHCAYSNIALAYLRKGDYGKSIEYYKKLLAINPDDPDTFVDLAYAYVKNRQYDEAIEYYNKAMKHGSHYFKAKEGLNTALNLKGGDQSYDGAIKTEEVAEAVEKPDKSKDHYFDLAVNYLKEQNFDLAIENLRKCLRVEPGYTKANVLLDKVFKLKTQMANNPGAQEEKKSLSPAEMLKKLSETKTQVDNNLVVQEEKKLLPSCIDYKTLNESYNLGISFFQAKNYDLALTKFKYCLEIDPTHKTSKEYLKKIFEIKGLI